MRKRIMGLAVVFVLGIGGISFGLYQYEQKESYHRMVSNDYQRVFYDAVVYVDNVDKNLDKVRLAREPKQSAILFADIWRQAGEAHNNLSSLPYNAVVVTNTLKYLTQVSDYSYAMMAKAIDGTDMDKEDWQNIEKLRTYSGFLSGELNNMVSQITLSGGVPWDKIKDEYEENLDKNPAPKAILGSMVTVSKQFQEYPSLIYDGPFSEHILTMEPLMTKNAKPITMEQGKDIVKHMLQDEPVEDVRFISETDASVKHVIPVYHYEVRIQGFDTYTISIDVTKNGGYPLWMLNYQSTSSTIGAFISVESALAKADSFLKANNFRDMKYSYYELSDDSIVINYAQNLNGVTIYTDLVKVKVSLIDGTILGFEAQGYISMHHERKIEAPKLSVEAAKKNLYDKFVIENTSTVIIPLQSKEEALCYEFKGKLDDNKYLIYINANTGKMENILQLIINEYGVLAE